MSGLRLPPGLVDLVLARTSSSAGRTKVSTGSIWQAAPKRHAHSSVVLKPRIGSSREYEQDSHSLYAARTTRKDKEKAVASFKDPQPRAISSLEDRVNALKNAVVSEDAMQTHEFYDEEELLAVYEDLLALPVEGTPDVQAEPALQQPEEDPLPIVEKVAERLLPDVSEPSTSAVAAQPLRHALIKHLEDAQAALAAAEASYKNAEGATADSESTTPLSIVLVSAKEWKALVTHCVRERDVEAAERVLDLMQRSKCDIPEESLDDVLAIYARTGDATQADKFASKFLSVSPSERQRDLHIKTHLEATPETTFPTTALQLLHDYEGRALAPPQKTYSRLVTHLLSARSATAHAHAWDLFAHMRYVAHPKPDSLMYTTMIRACASPSLSTRGEPERALDLFTEMTVDSELPPTAGAYIATILACARSGREKYVHEAFRLAKEMMDAHRDAYGHSQFTPDRRFFCALLEGAKRIGDLARVRWILAEMVKESFEQGQRADEARVDPRKAIHEEAMLHVFHTYAAYKTPFHRSLAPKVSESAQDASKSEVEPAKADEQLAEEATEIVAEPDGAFSRLPPQSHAEVVHEAKALFARLLADSKSRAEDGIFAHVELTPRLLNAYLSVHYAHAPIETWSELFRTLHADVGVPRNAWSYVEALERCAAAKKTERTTALQLAEEIFPQWQALEVEWRVAGPVEIAAHARLIERTHAAMIRVYSLTNNVQRAVDAVKAFVAAYPPQVVREPPSRLPFRSMRTNLVAARPLVRMFNPADIPDDAVPPLLSFTEVEVLHHRLVAAGLGRAGDIRYLKWVCKAYEGALRRRREQALQATMHPIYKPESPTV